MVALRQAVVLLVVLLGACCASAYPMIWTAMAKDCAAVPQAGYGPHSAPVQDSKTLMTIKKNGGVVAKICPGVVHKIKAVFPEQRQYILTSTTGGFAGTAAECPNRFFSQVAKPDMETDFTVACDATGSVTLTLLSVGARSSDRTYQAITTTMPVKELEHCPASPCHSQAAQQPAASTNAQQPPAGTLLPESAPLLESSGAAAALPALDPALLANGTISLQDLVNYLAQQQALQTANGGQGPEAITVPTPDAAAAPAADAPKVFQIGDLFGGLKHILPGQGGDAAAQHKDGVNPLKFLQTISKLMPNQPSADGQQEGASPDMAQNALKMIQGVADLVQPKDGSKESGAPIFNLLQTVGNVIGGNSTSAQKDGLPILNMLQTLGSAIGQGGKDGKGLDPAAMLDVVKSLGTLMPNQNGDGSNGPNMQNMMSFMNAVGKVAGAGGNEPGPKDLPTAAIAVLKSLGPLLPKEAAAGGQPQPPNVPAMINFVKATGNLITLLRPAMQAGPKMD